MQMPSARSCPDNGHHHTWLYVTLKDAAEEEPILNARRAYLSAPSIGIHGIWHVLIGVVQKETALTDSLPIVLIKLFG